MVKCKKAGIHRTLWHNPGHQLPRSLHLHSMEHPLSVNTLMGGKPNNTEGRGQEYTQKLHRDKWILGQCFTHRSIVSYSDNASDDLHWAAGGDFSLCHISALLPQCKEAVSIVKRL